MKILYDYQIFEEQSIGGISRYFHELILEQNLYTPSLSLKFSNNIYLGENHYLSNIKSLEEYKLLDCLSKFEFKGKNRIVNLIKKEFDKKWINRKNSIADLKKGNFDVFHPTYFNPYFLDYIRSNPFVITVYDMIHEKFPSCFKSGDQTANNKKLLCEKANHIIAISQSTKNDLIQHLSINESKISVVYLSSSLDVSISTTISGLPESYILYVGSRFGYKNFKNFILGSLRTLKRNKELFIVCTGLPFTNDEIVFFRENNILERVLHFFVNDQQLVNLYQNAVVFVFPSLYEGFGIPTLEAFSCQCPVILSNTSSLKEIGENAAIYIEPNDIDDIEEKIEIVVNDCFLREKLKKMGQKQLEKFSWLRCRMKHKSIYNSL